MRRGAAVLAVCALGAAAAPAAASIPPPGVPNANHRAGHPANKVAPGFIEGPDNEPRSSSRACGLRDDERLRLKILDCTPAAP